MKFIQLEKKMIKQPTHLKIILNHARNLLSSAVLKLFETITRVQGKILVNTPPLKKHVSDLT
jgi:hypothetical protein